MVQVGFFLPFCIGILVSKFNNLRQLFINNNNNNNIQKLLKMSLLNERNITQVML